MATDGPGPTVLRVRHVLAENLAIAVVICLLLAGAGGFVAYEEYAAPDTRIEQRTVATWTTDSQFAHSATVQRSTRAFDAGDVLRNRSAYLLSVAPELTATHVYSHEGDAGTATVSTNVTLVKRAVDRSADQPVEYWRVTDRLAHDETTLEPGETATTTFSLDIPEQRNETEEIEAELGGTPGQIQLYVLVETRAETTLAGQERERSRTDRIAIRAGGTTYGVETNTSGERSDGVSEATTVPIESNALRIYGGSLFALLWLGVGAALVWADREERLAVPAETVTAIRHERARDRFDEWISTGSVPDQGADERLVRIDSLEDLVDVAIDSERRVIENVDSRRYVVIVDETWYVYEAESVSESTARSDEAQASADHSRDGHENGDETGASDSDASVPAGDR